MPETNSPSFLRIAARVKATSRYRKFLEVSSVFLTNPFTKVEMDLLDELYHQGGQITTDSRKTIRDNLDVSPEQLNNYIRALRKKGVIHDDVIVPALMCQIPAQSPFNIVVQLQVEV